MTDKIIEHYNQNADRYCTQYDSIAAEDVHTSWKSIFPHRAIGRALDVGAGSGRDAHWLAGLGWTVDAVEPADGLRLYASANFNSLITWHDDRLPFLGSLIDQECNYELILLSAVWMHVPPSSRAAAINNLRIMLAPGGLLVITLRFGPNDKQREMYPVNTQELGQLAFDVGLIQVDIGALENSSDQLLRAGVHWKTVVYTTVNGAIK